MLVNMNIECFMRACSLVLFFPALCRPIGGAVIRQNLSVMHLLNFFVDPQVCVPGVGSCLCVMGLEVIKASSYVLGISED